MFTNIVVQFLTIYASLKNKLQGDNIQSEMIKFFFFIWIGGIYLNLNWIIGFELFGLFLFFHGLRTLQLSTFYLE